MSQREIEGALLDVHFGDGELRLRLDKNGITLGEAEEPSVVTLTLSGCSDLSEAGKALNQPIGKWLYCQFTDEADGITAVYLDIDYSVDEVEVRCACVAETESGYTLEDFERKCRWLSSLYLAAEDRESKIQRRHNAFTTGLKAEIDRELDRCRRKLEFFTAAHPDRAAAMQAQVRAYERVLTLMTHLQKPGQETAEPGIAPDANAALRAGEPGR